MKQVVTVELTEMGRLDVKYERGLIDESKVYQQIILNCWTRLDPKRKGIWFERIQYSTTAIRFKVAINRRDRFYWLNKLTWNALPSGVYAKDLISKEVLTELGIACQRKVTAVADINGLWVIVHRAYDLDTTINEADQL